MGWITSGDADEIVDWFIENYDELDDVPAREVREALDPRAIVEQEFGHLGYKEEDVEQAILRLSLLGDLWVRSHEY